MDEHLVQREAPTLAVHMFIAQNFRAGRIALTVPMEPGRSGDPARLEDTLARLIGLAGLGRYGLPCVYTLSAVSCHCLMILRPCCIIGGQGNHSKEYLIKTA
jgi:hypothetical protein